VTRWRPVTPVMTYAELEDTDELETKCTRLDPAVCTSFDGHAFEATKAGPTTRRQQGGHT
jgi:hypothetical protein